jgi:hypothetical protein
VGCMICPPNVVLIVCGALLVGCSSNHYAGSHGGYQSCVTGSGESLGGGEYCLNNQGHDCGKRGGYGGRVSPGCPGGGSGCHGRGLSCVGLDGLARGGHCAVMFGSSCGVSVVSGPHVISGGGSGCDRGCGRLCAFRVNYG